MSGPLLWPFLAVLGAILIVLSLLGDWLRGRARRAGTSAAAEAFNTRIAAWWAIWIFFIAAALVGRGGAVALFAVLSFVTLREFLTLTAKDRGDHLALLAAFFVVLPVQYWLIGTGHAELFDVLIPVYAFLFLPALSAVKGAPRAFLARVSQTQWGLMICVFAVSHAAAILTLDIPGYAGWNLSLVIWLAAVVQAGDGLQELWGLVIGRHLVAPAVSSFRSWEGAAAGVASAGAIGMALSPVTPFTVSQAGLMAIILAAMGQCGGLVMAAIKRDRGVRDWGHLAMGHCGFLDRLASVIFAAPVLFHLTRFFWAVH